MLKLSNVIIIVCNNNYSGVCFILSLYYILYYHLNYIYKKR